MGVRDYQELGENLQKIIQRLMANDRLVNLLYYTDKDPINQPILTAQQKQDLIFEKKIKITPRIGPKEDASSLLVVKVVRANQLSSNTEFMSVMIQVEIVVPLTQWIIKDSNLRPFLILGEIKKSLNGKTVNGLGKLVGGDFNTNYYTEEVAVFEQDFFITAYE